MHQVTRWFVADKLEENPDMSFEQLKECFPLADDEEIKEGIKEFMHYKEE